MSNGHSLPLDITLMDFYAYLPKNEFIFVPAPDVLWKPASINQRLPPVTLTNPDGTVMVDKDGEIRKRRRKRPPRFGIWLTPAWHQRSTR